MRGKRGVSLTVSESRFTSCVIFSSDKSAGGDAGDGLSEEDGGFLPKMMSPR